MARRPPSSARLALAERHDPQGLPAFVMRYLEWLRVHHYAEPTVANRELYLGYFVAWCAERGLTQPKEITKPILERYQRALYHLRKANGAPLTFRGQHARLVPIRGFSAGSRGRTICSTTRPRSLSYRAWRSVYRSTCSQPPRSSR